MSCYKCTYLFYLKNKELSLKKRHRYSYTGQSLKCPVKRHVVKRSGKVAASSVIRV